MRFELLKMFQLPNISDDFQRLPNFAKNADTALIMCFKEQFFGMCESVVRNCPLCARLLSLVRRHKTQT